MLSEKAIVQTAELSEKKYNAAIVVEKPFSDVIEFLSLLFTHIYHLLFVNNSTLFYSALLWRLISARQTLRHNTKIHFRIMENIKYGNIIFSLFNGRI